MRGWRSFEGRAGLILINRGAGGGEGGKGRVGQHNLCVETINHSCGEGGGEEGGGGGRALGRIDVGVCYTRGARFRRWCGWWGRRGRWGREGGWEFQQRHERL